MKVCIINPILYTANNNVIHKVSSIKDCMIYNLSLGFKQLGHEVSLIAAEDYKPINTEDYQVELIYLKSHFKTIFLPSVLPFTWKLTSFLRENKNKYDLIISSELFSFASLFSAIICPKKTLIWHELAIHNRKFKYIPSKLWYNLIVPIFFKNVITTPRSFAAYKFLEQFRLNKITQPVEHGVNLKKFSYQTSKKNQFIIVSQLIERKNIGSIITIYYSFIKEYKVNGYKLLIVGRGPMQQELEKQIISLKLEDQVELLGYKSHIQLKTLLAESKGLLINTKQDNNMVSIPEAIASGTPIIMNTVPTNADIVKENKLGIVKENWDKKELKEAIDNNDFYIHNCISYRQKLSTETCAQSLINIFFHENTSLK